jgi:uncharacterized protein YrrD
VAVRRARDAIGLTVITQDSGKKVGRTQDLVLDRQGQTVLGVLLDEAGWFKEAQVVPWASVRVMGLDALIVDTETSIKKASDVPEMKEVLERGYVLKGLRIHTTQGLDLGEVEDVLFDPAGGSVEGFMLSGRGDQNFLPYSPSFVAGEDVAFVDPTAESTITNLTEALSTRGT